MTDKICCNCQYYGGVKGSHGHAPCELKNSMTTWSKTCESIYLIPLRLLIGTTDEPETKADRIRSMSDEEMAKTFADYISCHNCPIPYCKVRFTMERLGCQANWFDWLKQEAEDGE